jgi:uncharacterized membrane protein YkvA (DUF1232 family)
LLEKLKQRARQIKSETLALYLAARDPRTPWYAKLLVAGIVTYAFRPIDLMMLFLLLSCRMSSVQGVKQLDTTEILYA